MVKKIFRTFLSLILTVSLGATTVMAAPSVNDLQNNKTKTESQIADLKTRLTSMMENVSNLEVKLVDKGKQVIASEKALKTAEEKEKAQYSSMKSRIKFMYERDNESLLETLLSSKSFADFVNTAEYIATVHTYDRKMLSDYEKTKADVAKKDKKLKKEQKELENKEKEFETSISNIQSLIDTKKQEIAGLDSQIADIQAEAARKAAEQVAAEQAKEKTNDDTTSNDNSGSKNNNNSNNNSNNNNNSNSNNNNNSGNNSGGSNKPSTPDKPVNGNAASKIVNAAYSQLGVPYVWGAESPGVGFDCSGLVKWCLAQAGIYVDHYSESIYAQGKYTTNPQPGDIMWRPGHVGIYIGNGMMIHAPHTGTVVKIAPVGSVGGYCTFTH
ncbi:MAG: C40 family peptidase [Lachnospiraceae bacterium]|jgi:cell wall-associated NlpC family hydrolase|nr:C40 family peptidase [Lachnospiraceae bacterium]